MVLAWRGLRNMDQGVEVVSDPAVREAGQRQARKVHLLALLTTALSTGVFLALPVP